MTTPDEDVDDVRQIQAMYFALESLCLAIVKSMPNAATVIENYQSKASGLDVTLLYDGETPDAVVHEIELAHARISSLLSSLRIAP